MPSEETSTPSLEQVSENAEFVADSAFRLLRLDMVLIGIYITAGGFITSLNPNFQQKIWTSRYMAGSVVLLLMSVVAGYLTYESASRIAAVNMYENPEEVYQRYNSTARLVFNLRYSVLLALLSGFGFGFGVLDGVSPEGVPLSGVFTFIYALLVLTTLPIVSAHFGLRIFERVRSFRSSD